MAKPEHLLARLSAGGAIDILTRTWQQEEDDRPLNFGDYQTVGLIDRGGMSEVYEARRADGRFDRSVAIKVMLGTLFDAEAYRRFRREVEFLARLNHPNIAQLYDAGITERRQPYILMELVRGERIDTFHLRRRPALQEKIRHLLQLADALALAHAQLVIHRDIKPTNVLVTEDGVPKLLDFGIAKRLAESRAETTTNPMTPAYASPEQLLGLPVTVASDIFQLARLFTTCFPQYRGDARATDCTEEDRQTLQALHRDEIPPSCARVIEHLPPDLGAVILKALSPDPADRYLSAQDFAADLRAYSAGYPVQARRNNALRRGLKFLRRNAATGRPGYRHSFR
ncbi:MAG: serine/threonine-protein kinase [Gammaproteobacteria bacterium]|nr:serine/threonine-protein kinase [Gammaproteobacteria bacterium]